MCSLEDALQSWATRKGRLQDGMTPLEAAIRVLVAVVLGESEEAVREGNSPFFTFVKPHAPHTITSEKLKVQSLQCGVRTSPHVNHVKHTYNPFWRVTGW